MKTLYIYCAGGFGKEVMDVAQRLNKKNSAWSQIHFVDDAYDGNMKYGARVVRWDNLLGEVEQNQVELVIANGEPSIREKIHHKIKDANFTLGQVIDNTVVVAQSSKIDEGVVITPFCSISSDVVIKKNASVNTMSIVGHDVSIGEHAVISSMVNIGGACKIGKGTYIGMGALIKEGLSIGDEVIIGMGSVVYNDIPDGMIALGNPARVVKKNENKRVFK